MTTPPPALLVLFVLCSLRVVLDHSVAMLEMAPAASGSLVPGSVEKPPPKRRGKRRGLGAAPKSWRFLVSRLIPEALLVSQEQAGLTLSALRKALAALATTRRRTAASSWLSKRLVIKGS